MTHIAPCGIDCSACSIYIAAHDAEAAERLAQEWKSWQPAAEASWFKCRGCRGDRSACWSENCDIHACCVEDKGMDSCSQCGDFPCSKLAVWAADSPHHAAALEYLKQMR
ncbi:MAG: DUF3795 domain-containing protein [Armatimonadota bacterium]